MHTGTKVTEDTHHACMQGCGAHIAKVVAADLAGRTHWHVYLPPMYWERGSSPAGCHPTPCSNLLCESKVMISSSCSRGGGALPFPSPLPPPLSSHLLCESKVISRLFFQLLMPSSWAWVSVSQSENCCTRNSSTCREGGGGEEWGRSWCRAGAGEAERGTSRMLLS